MAWWVYPLNFTSETTFLTIVPRTRPASEFHSTWSPRLNVWDIVVSLPVRRRIPPNNRQEESAVNDAFNIMWNTAFER